VLTAILGISAYYHDSAAALVIDGKIVAAAQEERFTRQKHDEGFPARAVEYCLAEAGIGPGDLDYVGFYDKPFLKFDRLLETYLAYAPAGFHSFSKALPVWLKKKLHLPREMSKGINGYKRRYLFTEHHESHAASAFFPSPFDEAAILTLDGVGEWATAAFGVGRGNRIQLTHEQRFPHSLGLLYSAFTYYCGFKVNDGEYKLMGLAPYGEPRYVDLILEKLIDLKEDGSFRMDMSYFNYAQGLTMTSRKFDALFGAPPRKSGARPEQRDMDIAASAQRVAEDIMLRSARHVHRETGMKNLCLAGGVALNCVGNGRILREGPFEQIWIQPAAGDAGGALGAALLIWHQLLGKPRHATPGDSQQGSLLGSDCSDDEIESVLCGSGAIYQHFDDEDALCKTVADEIARGSVVGWFQGRMEFGPRALGSRSILADARSSSMQATINMKVKFREGFRPFAPIVLAEHASEYFELDRRHESPYMLVTAPVRNEQRVPVPAASERQLGVARSTVPAITHVDYSARIQTVDVDRNPMLAKLMRKFHEQTGCPVLVNTSFNLGWDPIVESPLDAYRTFMACDIDVLCMGRYLLTKPEQPAVVASHSNHAWREMLASPCCGADFEALGGDLVCTRCKHAFRVTDGIPELFWPHGHINDPRDVTEIVKAFYEETPFPNYDDHDTLSSLIDKSRRGLYARRLDEAIPYNSAVLEVGCGTGQLSNFLGISCRRVVGTDICMNSLRLGDAFRKKHGLDRVRFTQMNLFRPVFKPAQFDVVLCNGVLHHTADPFGGFKQLTPLVKPGGYMIVGLYNQYGRLATDARRKLFRMTGGRARWIDPVLRKMHNSAGKERAWFADQYRHPHESKHTFDEVLAWFEATGLEFVRGVPAMRLEDDGLEGENLFEPQPRGNALDHRLAQWAEIVAAGQREGGFFVMIGRRPAASDAYAGRAQS
jgi:carbamoyltransferase